MHAIRVHRVDQNSNCIYTDSIPLANVLFYYGIHTTETAVYSVCAYNIRWMGRAVKFFADGDTVRMGFAPDGPPKWYSASPLDKELLRVNGMADCISLCCQAEYAKYADCESLSEAERKEYKAQCDSCY